MLDFGLSRTEFFSSHFEQNPLLVHGALGGKPLFAWSDVDDILHAWNVAEADIELRKGHVISPELYVQSYQDIDDRRLRLLAAEVRRYIEEGATLVMRRLDLRCRKVARLCDCIAEYTGHRLVADGYVALRGEGAFGKHWETHDVFAVQLLGRKRWRLYRPTFPLPMPEQNSFAREEDCPARPALDIWLEAGDLLYIPRGWWHETLPQDGMPSFHVAAGAHTGKVADYIAWCCDRVLPDLLGARATLRPGADNMSVLRELLDEMPRRLLDERLVNAFLRQIQAMGNHPYPGITNWSETGLKG
ncbi:JmjC domain-containing protein [Achromobacter aloeverae]|uniref:Cupin n=1 Tax=Achromobacter aloeverae TaxID=1750518 RepID=A0A4Q1HQ15_9BURK|nr:cupin domain-containing protein [Achromobacter aloeverae]RXN93029.1 cupin [Achromobacter aloeverae]